jgi:FixJ family two-component response regulator
VAADGLATLQRIIEEPPAVVLLDIQALSHGAIDFVKKPLDLSYLERSIQAAITLAVQALD